MTSVGYGDQTVLSDINLRIDQDDRIAILGQNGEGKSTLSKLIAKMLKPHVGKIIHSNKLRIGYFAQHQVDRVEAELKLQWIMCSVKDH